ncbi:MAG: class I SAM-dependent methyltransferase, partial [Ignavibacteria bacterium]|nr:class I SAM-dependent methyltransferase [Ignavibacteria bacterium]
DLPGHDRNANYNLIYSEISTGWVVPKELRSRWKLILGDSKIELPRLLKEITKIDVFFHDSDHSYENMKYEYNIVFPSLKNEGIILSDDIHKNNAFNEFINQHNLRAIIFSKGGCLIK